LTVTEGAQVVLLPSLSTALEDNAEITVELSSNRFDVTTTFSSVPATITIPAGQTSGILTLNTIDDSIYEGTRVFTLNLSGHAGTISISQSSMTLTINDNEAKPVINFSTASQSVSEGAGSGTAVANLSQVSAYPITVTYAVADSGATNGTD
jgi:hypothetical protein